MRYFILILLSAITLLSCREKTTEINVIPEPEEYITIKITDTATLKLSEIFKSVKFIPLNENQNGAKVMSKILFRNNHIFIMDNEVALGIFMYTKEGKFIKRLEPKDHNGTSPTDISDFDVYNNKISVSYHPDILVTFDSDGNYLDKSKASFQFSSFITLDSGYLFYNGYMGTATNAGTDFFNVIQTDDSLDFKNGFLPYEPELVKSCVVAYPSHFARTNKEILFSHSFTNAVYSYQNGKMDYKVHIKIDKNPIPSEITSKFVNRATMENIFKNGYSQLLSPFYTSEKYGVYKATYGPNSGYIFRTPGRQVMVESHLDDLYGIPIYDYLGGLDDNHIVGSVNWSAIASVLHDSGSQYLTKDNPYKKKLLNFMKTYNIKSIEEANPVIAILEFKS